MNQGRKDRPQWRANEPVAVPVQIAKTNSNAGSQCIADSFPDNIYIYSKLSGKVLFFRLAGPCPKNAINEAWPNSERALT
jgi:hypothetical protein